MARVSRVKSLQVARQEPAVFPNQEAVQPDPSSSVLRPLDTDEIPMDRGAVPVIRTFICTAWRQVKGPSDFLIKKDVADRFSDGIVDAKGKLANPASPRIGVKNAGQRIGITV